MADSPINTGLTTAQLLAATMVGSRLELATVGDFPTGLTDTETGTIAYVVDSYRGGLFIYDNALVVNDDQGINFNGWIRQNADPCNPDWFDDGTPNNNVINLALQASTNIKCTRGATYLIGRLKPRDNTIIDLNGALWNRDTTLIGGGSGWERPMIYVDSNEATAGVLTGLTVKNGTVDDFHSEVGSGSRNFIYVTSMGSLVNCLVENIDFLDSASVVQSTGTSGMLDVYGLSYVRMRGCSLATPTVIPKGVQLEISDLDVLPYAIGLITNGEHVIVEDCFADGIYSGAITQDNEAAEALNILNTNIHFRNNSFKNTWDTSLYIYGSNSSITGNAIHDPGKDGLKINTHAENTGILSRNNIISGNTLTGCPIQHNAGGSSMIVSVGGHCIISDNTMDMYGKVWKDENTLPRCISIEGEGCIASNNVMRAMNLTNFDDTPYYGIGVWFNSLKPDASSNSGGLCMGNTIDCDYAGIRIPGDRMTGLSVIGNTIQAKRSGMLFEMGQVDDVRKPLFAIVSNNTIVGTDAAAVLFNNPGADRVAFSGNSCSGLRERDSQKASDVGSWIGSGNVSHGFVADGFDNYKIVNRGLRFSAAVFADIMGTFKAGEIVGSEVGGFICLTSGTMGTTGGILTAATTAGSKVIVMSITEYVYEGMYITIAGETGTFTVESVNRLAKTEVTVREDITITNATAAVEYAPATFSAESEFYA